MKRLFVIFLCIAFVTSCTTSTTQIQKPVDDNTYTFKVDKWQTFFYQDDAKTGLLIYQVKDMNAQQIPKEFKVGEIVYTVRMAYPKIEVKK